MMWGRLIATTALVVYGGAGHLIGGSEPASPVEDVPSALALFAQAFRVVHTEYVDAVPARDLIQAAIRGMLAQAVPEGTATPPGLPAPARDAAARDDAQVQLRAFAAVFEKIQARYGPALSPEEAVHAAIAGLVASTDPHGRFLTPAEVAERQRDARVEAGGIGVHLTMSDGHLMVVAPLPGAPADRGGLRSRDRIVQIDGMPTEGMSLQAAVRALQGSAGSRVWIGLLREGEADPVELSMVREVVAERSIHGQQLGEDLYNLRIRYFGRQTAEEMERELPEVRRAGATGVVLDLRDNPGGNLLGVVETAELFLDKGQGITYTQSRRRDQNLQFAAQETGRFPKLPLVVLVNQGTCAGAEIVAAALQDWKRGVLLGSRTAGRVSLQTIIPLADGSEIILTTARWRSPHGRSVEHDGITPNFVVPPSRPAGQPGGKAWLSARGLMDAEVDVQLQQAIAVLHAPRK